MYSLDACYPAESSFNQLSSDIIYIQYILILNNNNNKKPTNLEYKENDSSLVNSVLKLPFGDNALYQTSGSYKIENTFAQYF